MMEGHNPVIGGRFRNRDRCDVGPDVPVERRVRYRDPTGRDEIREGHEEDRLEYAAASKDRWRHIEEAESMDDRPRDSKAERTEREELREALHYGVGMRVMPLEGDALEPMCELPSIVAPSGEDAEQALATGDLLLLVLEVLQKAPMASEYRWVVLVDGLENGLTECPKTRSRVLQER